jgi:hypothetical protein
MSDGSIPGSTGVGTATGATAEMSPGPGEFDLGYDGWRVVLAA